MYDPQILRHRYPVAKAHANIKNLRSKANPKSFRKNLKPFLCDRAEALHCSLYFGLLLCPKFTFEKSMLHCTTWSEVVATGRV
nr:unnamed protein product [Callosobruchus chinensis]